MNHISWRRMAGVTLMMVGAAVAVAVALVSALIVARQWHVAGDALKMVTALGGPVTAGGLALMIFGRAVYGSWNGAAPLATTVSYLIRTAGLLIAIVLGAMLVFLIAAGVGPDDLTAATLLGVGTLAGVALVVVGSQIKDRNRRRYLD